MKPEINPEKIKRSVYISFFQDGLWDLVLGLFFLGWGLAVMFDLTWLPGATFVSFFWIALGLKQKITYPRIGYAKPAEHRKQTFKFIIAGTIALLIGIAVFLLVTTGGMPQFLRDYFEFLFGSILAVSVTLIGYWWGINRWYAYGGLVFVFAVFNQWLGLSFELSFVIPGGVIFLYGLIIFIRFLRKYQRVSIERLNGNE